MGLWLCPVHKFSPQGLRRVVVPNEQDPRPEALGRARGASCAGRTRPPVRGPAPGPRGDLAPGFRGAAAIGPAGSGAWFDPADGGPTTPPPKRRAQAGPGALRDTCPVA